MSLLTDMWRAREFAAGYRSFRQQRRPDDPPRLVAGYDGAALQHVVENCIGDFRHLREGALDRVVFLEFNRALANLDAWYESVIHFARRLGPA
ncbi:unnamed protein product [Zymoseptoria tritici ST99CH_3D1]|nr:unnamed protein product [Zymoseptoria tritici ST99CH_3D1]